jgi:ribosomal protein S18 acetylase RimI-like enzyme
MTPSDCRLAIDLSKGSVILPLMLEDPLASPEFVGRMLGRSVQRGECVTMADLNLSMEPDCIPLFEYFERPGGVERLVDLDRRTFDELGFDFSDKPWTEENFRMVLPGKAEVSFVVELDGEFIGYCIGSENVPGEVHGHRIVIEPRWRTGRLAMQVWCAHWRMTAANPDNIWLSGEVATANRRMRRFLEVLGFDLLTADETQTYLDRRGRDEKLEGAEIIGEGGARSIVMTMRVRDSD